MAADDEVINRALSILEARMAGEGMLIGHPVNLFKHAYLELAQEQCEVKLGYWLDANNRLLGWDRIAYGGESSVIYSLRHAARLAISAGAVGAYFLHNHPAGSADPSQADIKSADRLSSYMAAVDVLTLGHFVLGRDRVRSVTSCLEFEIIKSEYTGQRCPHCNWPLEQEVTA